MKDKPLTPIAVKCFLEYNKKYEFFSKNDSSQSKNFQSENSRENKESRNALFEKLMGGEGPGEEIETN